MGQLVLRKWKFLILFFSLLALTAYPLSDSTATARDGTPQQNSTIISNRPPQQGGSGDNIWQDVDEPGIQSQGVRVIFPDKFRLVAADINALDNLLAQAPPEDGLSVQSEPVTITLPMPDGDFQRFRLESYSMVKPPHPDIQTYKVYGLSDSTAGGVLDRTPAGLRGMIVSDKSGTLYIDPYSRGDIIHYMSYYHQDAGYFWTGPPDGAPDFIEEVSANGDLNSQDISAASSISSVRREYDMAIATTAEYTAYFGGKTQAFANNTTIVNRLNAIYEVEFGVRLNLINDPRIIFTDAATDGYTNGNVGAMLNQNQPILDSILGNNAYDIGHALGTNGGGGVAGLRVVCNNNRKADGASASNYPDHSGFAQGLVAHEVGHQFGAGHTFNANTSGNCSGGNYSSSSAYEPGSGSTIMSYAGSCGSQNLGADDHYFHVGSFEQIAGYINGNGNTCATHVNTGNPAPTVEAGPNYTIPKDTPFILNGTASDATVNGSLSYTWDQFEVGAPWSNATVLPNTDHDAARPTFRSYPATTETFRNFPRLTNILDKTYQNKGEALPRYPRAIPFKFHVRDNQGGIANDTTHITIDNSVGPFRLTAPLGSEIWGPNSLQTVTWNVAGTTGGSVNCSTVDIVMSTDGGQTYPLTIATNTPNDGSQQVTMPNVAALGAVLKVQCTNNIFFDASNIDVCTPLYFDTHEDGFSDWTTAQAVGNNPWAGKTDGGFSGNNYWNVPNPGNITRSDSYLTSNSITASADNLILRFQHNYQFQSFSNNRNDGGRVEISINGGPFQDIGQANFTQNGYTAQTSATEGSPLAGQWIFAGNSGGYVGSTASLSHVNTNDTFQIRFRMATDWWYGFTNYTGWSVDNVLVCSQSVAPAPALTLTKSAPASAVANQSLKYTLLVKNTGSDTANNVTLTDALPNNIAFVSASNGGSEAGGTVTWNLGNIAVGQALTRSFTVTVNSGLSNGAIIANTGQASATNMPGTVDSNTVNTTVAAPILDIAIESDPDPIMATTTLITYTITIKNSGSATATNVTVINTIPMSTTYVPNSASDGGQHAGGKITWQGITVNPGASVARTYQVQVTQSITDGDKLTNVGNVSSQQGINIGDTPFTKIVGGGGGHVYLPIVVK